jgi:lipoprotein-anchoring transpeptidase ErfK/SrfK
MPATPPHPPSRACRRAAGLLLAAAVLAVLASGATAHAGGAAATPTVDVWFLQGEQVIAVKRPGETADDAVRALLAGPTPDELGRGIRTYVPTGTPLRSVAVANGVATVDLGIRFVQGRDAQSLLARLSQVVHTATGPEGALKVRLLVKGGTPLGVFPGASVSGAITVGYLETPNVPTPKPPAATPTPVRSDVRAAQERLAALGYLLPAQVDGQAGPTTQAAVLAFQKWEGLERDGEIGPQTTRRLASATRPTPITRGPAGRRTEVLLDRQVTLAIEDNRVVRALHISSGAPTTPTPPGDFKVYAKYAKWWSVPFREWLLWALPFNGGIAFHELAEVPPYAASHGCVRESYTTAKWLYDFGSVGMPVKVMATSR